MTIQYCSDLHLEFPANQAYLRTNPIIPIGEILLLAGDIMPFIEIAKEKEFFDFLSENFQHTYWVPGNHEYYRSDITEWTGSFQRNVRTNVSLLNNVSTHYKDLRLVFTTLWSKIHPAKESIIKQSMADFHLIKNDGKKITTDDYNQLHEDCRAFLIDELRRPWTGKTVIVSHHIPTFVNYPEKYRHSELNTAFAVELSDLIETSNADYWIFGHSHEVVPDFQIGNTILTTNQLGYVQRGEHLSFMDRKVITI